MARKIIADTSGIIALLDRDDRYHYLAVEAIRNKQIFIPVTILPEVDYLATKYLGERVARAFLTDITEGKYSFLPCQVEDIEKAIKIMSRYQDLPLGFVDASVVVLAERGYQLKAGQERREKEERKLKLGSRQSFENKYEYRYKTTIETHSVK